MTDTVVDGPLVMYLPLQARRKFDEVLVRQKDQLIDSIESARILATDKDPIKYRHRFRCFSSVLATLDCLKGCGESRNMITRRTS